MRVLKLIFKNALRHKLRTSLTILGMAIAVMAFGVLRTVVDMYYEGLEATAANRLITRHSVSFVFPLPISYRDQISKISGVETVSFANWFGGTYKDKNNFFARMGADPETIFEVYPEYLISAKELETFKQERNSCIVGSEIAKQYGFKIGDIIPLDGDIYPGKWEFVVRGIYKPRDKSTDATQMFFHWSAIDERMKVEMPRRAGNVMWYIIKIKDPAQAATISEQVDALFKNSSNSTKTETERAFTQGFISGASSLLDAMNAVSYIIIGIIMLVLGNTMIMSARERTCEYAVLKTLGFSGGHLFGLVFGESLFISVLGAGVGVLLTYPVVAGIAALVPKGFFPYFFITPTTLIIAASAALMVGIAASIFPIQRALRTKIVDGLRFAG
jgi:putative ABC transport system permease protein